MDKDKTDFRTLSTYHNRGKKFINNSKIINRIAILNDKQKLALNTALLQYIPVNEFKAQQINYKIGFSSLTTGWYHAPYIKEPTQRRNAKCSCGSGLKYKKCCMK